MWGPAEGEWAEGGTQDAQGGGKGRLALCLHAVPGWEAGCARRVPGGQTVSYTCVNRGGAG